MARTLTEIDADIAAVRTARTNILTGAQATGHSDGSRVQRADLAAVNETLRDLEKERKDVERQTVRRNGGGVFVGDLG